MYLGFNRYRHWTYSDHELKQLLRRIRRQKKLNRDVDPHESVAVAALIDVPKLNSDQRLRAAYLINKYDAWSE